MKNALRSSFMAVIFSMTLLSFGCQKDTAPNPTTETKPELRENTKPLQAADLVGYDGTLLRKSVDHIIDAKEKRNRELGKMAEGEPNQ